MTRRQRKRDLERWSRAMGVPLRVVKRKWRSTTADAVREYWRDLAASTAARLAAAAGGRDA